MPEIANAQKLFLPMYDGDHSAFQPYKLGEVVPNAADMDDFIASVFDGCESSLDPMASYFDIRSCLHQARRAYRDNPAFAQQLRDWCMAEAVRHYEA